jgi:hypothetical protein
MFYTDFKVDTVFPSNRLDKVGVQENIGNPTAVQANAEAGNNIQSVACWSRQSGNQNKILITAIMNFIIWQSIHKNIDLHTHTHPITVVTYGMHDILPVK